ncbi:tetratricopeptide repeat protein [Vibrio maerlii]|uniref:tetratricopeptide repeat protein n=1 Tax=Vibrio maerlii TaxID=2231648 RepID=UPI000E3D632A|nr:tetratricopeptide repeat protein [Vibrio maerlii]
MNSVRWITRLLTLMIALTSPLSMAKVFSSPILEEANQLVEIEPLRAKTITENYLSKRKLLGRNTSNQSAVTSEERDTDVRTPNATIDALVILARSKFETGDMRGAIHHLDKAQLLANEYKLNYLSLEVELTRVELYWRQNRNVTAANQALREITDSLKQFEKSRQLARALSYRTKMMRAQVASANNEYDYATQLYLEAEEYIKETHSEVTKIDYHIQVGKHYLTHQKYNLALSELLLGYWQAIEENQSAQLAKVNHLLATLFYERKVYDKSLEYLSQAADFYDNYNQSPVLAQVLKQMGDIYYFEGRYNLALVHYFNVIDHENTERNVANVIDIRLSLAATYLQLYNYALTEQYLERANELLQYTDLPLLTAKAHLLSAGVAYHQKQAGLIIEHAKQALEIGQRIEHTPTQLQAYRLLSMGYEVAQNYQASLETLKQHYALAAQQQLTLNQISEDAFRQQKDFVEKNLHYSSQTEELDFLHQEHRKFQKIAFALLIVSILLILFVWRRGYLLQSLTEKLAETNKDLYTHPRSGLKNLRLLNAKLATSLEKSSVSFEQWQVGDLINEPLNDRLRFTMIDLPFLRTMYLKHGYKAGLDLEKKFGEYLQSRLADGMRIYHFSDANILLVEPNVDSGLEASLTFNRIQQWINEFEAESNINRIVRIGIADYPFLPRAYTAINDKELIEILLYATSVAREASMKENRSHWTHLRAIKNAPAASLAKQDIRKACAQAIKQGLIKLHSSYQNEEFIKKLIDKA